MALNLKKQDQEFRNALIFHGDPKAIDLNRVLLNLFMLIKYDGGKPQARIGRKDVTIETLVKRLIDREQDGAVKGFSSYENAVRGWVISNLVDLVHRGNPEREALASLRAIHLNSYKYRNPKHARDYNIADQVFAMLQEAPGDLIKQLREFLSEGWDNLAEGLDKKREIDLDTLGILRIVERDKDDRSVDNQFRPPKCLCTGQARIFADDVRKLLVYCKAVPRHVLLEYLRIIIGLHVGLYLLKLFQMLPDWVAKGQRHAACQKCPVFANLKEPYKECPYQTPFVVDSGDNPENPIAKLAEQDALSHYARIHDYVRATFSINMALQFLGITQRQQTSDIDKALDAIKQRGTSWDQYFRIRQQNLSPANGDKLDEESMTTFQSVRDLGLPPFETYIEFITQARASFHFEFHRKLLDSLFQRNGQSGLIWAGRSRKHGRRFCLSSRLLETMVQLSVLKEEQNGSDKSNFHSEPILIDSFLKWMENRYGFILNGVDHSRFTQADISIHQAFRANINHLKERLREIGFFNVLSDAYIMQRIRPRYPIKESQ